MNEFDAALAAVFVVCMLGLWFALMVMGKRDDVRQPGPAPFRLRRLG